MDPAEAKDHMDMLAARFAELNPEPMLLWWYEWGHPDGGSWIQVRRDGTWVPLPPPSAC